MERTELWLSALGCGAAAYVIGSANLTIAAARLFRIDGLLKTGSGNPGVTNLFRVAGALPALTVLILELAKAFVALSPAYFLHLPETAPYLALLFVMGNLFPIFHGFQGGKGVAATVGSLLFLDFRVMLLGGAVFIVVFLVWRRVSASSLSMAASYPILTYALKGIGSLFFVTIVLLAILFVTHRSNIKRLLEGKEPPLKRNR
jgi:glycerol-3-phosphate acyltransferase PlsY